MSHQHLALFGLDPDVVHLNHGSFGACPIAILEHQAELRRQLEWQPGQFLGIELERLLDETRQAVARFLAADPEGLLFVRNATEGVNTVLANLPLSPGDELITTDHAYGACRNALEFFAQRRGAVVRVAEVPFPIEAPERVTAAVLEQVSPRTKLALIDHVTSPTGLVFPVEVIVKALADRGIDTLVDGAHAPGMLPLALDQLGAAYYTGNAHKWLCTPKGSAVLWVRADRRPDFRPLSIGWGASSPRTDRSRLLLEFDWTGTHDPTAVLCIPKAIELLSGLLPGGLPALRAHNHALVLEGQRILLEALEVAAPAPTSMIGSLAAVILPADASPTKATSDGIFDPLRPQLFRDFGIDVPVFPRPQFAQRVLRVSAQIYNHPDEYHRLAEALKSLR